MSKILPSFRKPPVVETAVSAQFKPIPGLTNAHLGMFWATIKHRFRKVSDAAPIPPQYEQLSPGSPMNRAPRFELAEATATARLQMLDESESGMAQVQRDRLIYNWHKRDGAIYPRWSVVLPEFRRTLEEFHQFLLRENLPMPEFDQWEVAYVNELPQGQLWQSPTDWRGIFPGIVGDMAYGNAEIETARHFLRYRLPQSSGRLYVEMARAETVEEKPRDVLFVRLTCRGNLSSPGLDGLIAGLNAGRENIVLSFTELSSEEAHKAWDRYQ